MKQSPKINPAAGMVLGILAVSTASIFVRFAQGEAPSLVIAAGRLMISSFILLFFAWKKTKQEIQIVNWKIIILVICSGIFLAVHFGTWISSLEFTTVASSVVLVNTAPLFVSILSPIFLKEKISGWPITGLIISICGSIFISGVGFCGNETFNISCLIIHPTGDHRILLGNLLAVSGALSLAGYLIIGRHVRRYFSNVVYIFMVYTIAALCLLLFVLASGQSFGGYSQGTYFWIFLLAIIPQLIGHSTVNYLLEFLSPIYISICLLGEPIGTIILAMVILAEIPQKGEILGGILILLGIILATITKNQIKKRSF